jgi:hypothetical protein
MKPCLLRMRPSVYWSPCLSSLTNKILDLTWKSKEQILEGKRGEGRKKERGNEKKRLGMDKT